MLTRLLTIGVTIAASALCLAAGFALPSLIPRLLHSDLANSGAGIETALAVALGIAILALILRRRRRRRPEPDMEPRGWSPDMRVSLKDGTWRPPNAPNRQGRSGSDRQ